MITREELIANESNWHNMNGLKPEVFDEINKISNLFYLKIKDSDRIYFGIYSPEYRSFNCHEMGTHKPIKIRREDISHFISLPALNFNFEIV
jgi:hypothetical protein